MNGVKLAIIGARGIGNHGGFETVVGELAPRLVEKGNEVSCSVRESADCGGSSEFMGVTLLRFPFSFPKSYAVGKLVEVLYDSYFVVKCKLLLKCDVVYCLGVASGLSLLLTRWSRCFSVVNVDGLEWTRGKFGVLARLFLRISFVASCVGSERIVLDNRQLITHIPERYKKKAVYIPYGVAPVDCDEETSDSQVSITGNCQDLAEGEYWLVVARLEPENNIDVIVKAYLLSNSTKPLVIVGGFSSDRYSRIISNIVGTPGNGKRVVMAGPIYDRERLTAIRRGCLAYIHGHSVGGTNPSLLEAMSVGNTIISHDNVFNREVCSESALYFRDTAMLVDLINEIDEAPIGYGDLGRKASERADRLYRWDDVVSLHEQMLKGRKSD